jgi:hypothetical protein
MLLLNKIMNIDKMNQNVNFLVNFAFLFKLGTNRYLNFIKSYRMSAASYICILMYKNIFNLF